MPNDAQSSSPSSPTQQHTARRPQLDRARFQRDGFLIVPDLLNQQEVTALMADLDGDFINGIARDTWDSAGLASRFAIWDNLKDDVWGAASTLPCIVQSLAELTGWQMAFFHGKVIFKEPGASASWEWHQDYGYWYHSFLYPRLASAWVALDPSTTANGCLQVLRGSHRLGRLEHIAFGDQRGIEPARFAQVQPHFELVDCEVTPGTVIFFDSGLIHGSRPNRSQNFRRSFIMCYSDVDNLEFYPNREPLRRPLCPISADDAILTAVRSRPSATAP